MQGSSDTLTWYNLLPRWNQDGIGIWDCQTPVIVVDLVVGLQDAAIKVTLESEFLARFRGVVGPVLGRELKCSSWVNRHLGDLSNEQSVRNAFGVRGGGFLRRYRQCIRCIGTSLT